MKLIERSRCARNLIFVTIGTPICHQRDAAELSEVDHGPEKNITLAPTMRQARGPTGTWSRGGGEWMGGLAPAIDLPYQLSGGAGEAPPPTRPTLRWRGGGGAWLNAGRGYACGVGGSAWTQRGCAQEALPR